MKVGLWTVTDKVKRCPIQQRMYCLCICLCGRKRWVSQTVLNRRASKACTKCSQARMWEYQGELFTTAMLMKKFNLRRETFMTRLKRGATLEQALTKPMRTWGRYGK